MGALKHRLYSTLGVAKECTMEEVTRAYRRLALKYHPDRNPDGIEEFKSISNAYAVLSDPDRRAIYDTTGSVAHFTDASYDTTSEAARQQRSAELADQVRDFFAIYAGSPEEREDVIKGYEKCNGNFKKMVRQYLLFDNGITTEVQRLHSLILQLQENGAVAPTAEWTSTSTPANIRKLEKMMQREREEAEEMLKEMGGGSSGGTSSGDGGLGALQLAMQKRQQATYESMLNHLETKYVSGKGSKGKRARASDQEAALAQTKSDRSRRAKLRDD